jgi:PAS domain S-box-containing protein
MDGSKPGTPARLLLRYSAALAAVGLAWAGRWVLDEPLGPRLPFMAFFLATVAVGATLGLGPALLSAVTGGLLTQFFFLEPRGSLAVADPADELGLVGYYTISAGIAVLTAALQSARRRAEQRLADVRAVEERLMMALEAAGAGTWDCDLATGRAEWSPEQFRLMGYEPGGVAPTFSAWRDRVHPDDRPASYAAIEAAVRGGSDYRHEYRVVFPNGRLRWVESRGRCVRDAAGRAVRIAGVTIDVDARRRAEDALHDKEARLRALFRSDVVGVLFGDVDGRVLEANDELLRIVGRPREDLASGRLRWDEITPPEHLPADAASVAEAKARGSCTPYEKEYLRPDGSRVPVLVGYVLLGEERRESVAFILDISGRKAAERQRDDLLRRERDARREADAANRAKDEFLSVLSHELRTPLTAMVGWLRLLRDRALPEEHAGPALESADRNASMITRLVDDLLDVSRIITGKMSLELRPVRPAECVEAAVEIIRPAAAAKGVALSVEAADPASRAALVLGDAERLRQVVWNLLQNAVKFTPAGGSVRASVRTVGDAGTVGDGGGLVEIAVSDTGEGIDPAFRPYVFERFRQADSGSARRHGGLGLGLSLVRHLTELHGGTVGVESEGLGRGATFLVRLPSARPGAPGSAPAEVEAEPPRSAARSLPLPTPSQPDWPQPTAMASPPWTPASLPASVAPTAAAPLAAPPAPAVPDGPPRTGGRNRPLEGLAVVVADDTEDTRELLATAMRLAGADVRSVPDAASAFDAVCGDGADGAPRRPDLLLTDIGMPGEDGFSLLRRIRAMPAERGGAVPALALTGFARPEDREAARAAGFQGHVSKPVDLAALVALVGRIVADSRSRRAFHDPPV